MSGRRVVADAHAAVRYVRALRRFLRTPVTPQSAIARVESGVRRREHAFLDLAERAIYANPTSPYRRLLSDRGVELDDLRRLTEDEGLEGALARLRDAGVYVTLEELRGMVPIRRGSLELHVDEPEFDNPLVRGELETGGRGTRSAGRRIPVDFDNFAQEAGYQALFLRAFAAERRPIGLWFPIPPGAGINNLLRQAKLGRPPARWFSQYRWRRRRENLSWWGLTTATVYGGGMRQPLPRPEYVPLAEAGRVARWLADLRRAGSPALLETNCSSAIRLCGAAIEQGLDISGSLLRVGGEPFTDPKAAVMAEAGTRACSHYSVGELGRVAVACGAPDELDDCHLALDKLAVTRRDRPAGDGAESVPSLTFTTLLSTAPRIALNLEVGDYAELERRDCGCALGEAGLDLHLHSIRSYEKLTTEGMNFLGAELLALIDEVLPARFGGRPTDYQLVERSEGAVTRIELRVAPRIGAADRDEITRIALEYLAGRGDGQRMMVDWWRQAGTFGVSRREPQATRSGKVLPLHLAR